MSLDKKDRIEAIQKSHQIATARQTSGRGRGGMVTSTPRGRGGPRGPRKATPLEIVTLSSDDECGSEESKSATKFNANLEKIVPKKAFEPEIVDDVVAGEFEFFEDSASLSISLGDGLKVMEL